MRGFSVFGRRFVEASGVVVRLGGRKAVHAYGLASGTGFGRKGRKGFRRLSEKNRKQGLTIRRAPRNILARARTLLLKWQDAHRESDGVSSNGRTAVSGAVCEGSTPSTPAIFAVYCTAHYVAPSSSGLGRRPLKAEVAGSNPVGATRTLQAGSGFASGLSFSPSSASRGKAFAFAQRLRASSAGSSDSAARSSNLSSNPMAACMALQKGLFPEAPQRHSA